jgi:aromatic-L-amino-acid decarboxylase
VTDSRFEGDIPPERFVEYGKRLVEWVGGYLANPERYPVVSRAKPGDIAAALPVSPPQAGESLDDIIADFERVIVPGITHWNHPGFFAYFAVSASAPGILAELLTAALNVNAMLWKTSPAATELEDRALDWLRQMLGLGEGWSGHINDTASISTMLALAAAREAVGLDVRERGMAGRGDLPPLRVYCSAHAHSSVDKGAITLGIGHENVVHIECDAQFRMRPDALRAAMLADVARGMRPMAVVATVGTTSTTSIDPLRAIAGVVRQMESEQRPWLHIDGAYGGTAAIVPELRHVLDGAELADSIVVNPHKWLFTPIDCSALYVRQPDVLRRAFSLVPEYLVTREQHEVVNLMDYGVQLGRRFRALKLWMVIRSFGEAGLAERIRHHCELARDLAAQIADTPGWSVVAPVPFSVVCMRYAPPGYSAGDADSLNEAIMRAVNATGRVFLSHTRLDGRYVIRVAIGNLHTDRSHIDGAWQLLQEAAARLDAG